MAERPQKIYRIGLALIAFLLFFAFESIAQCPMCRMSAESNMQNGGTAGAGLNLGILYMLAMPYLLVATIGFIWWRNRKKQENLIEE